MSGSASISLEQAILGHTLGFAQMAFPSQVFVALCSASMPPSETVRGIEAFGGGYTRMRATFALIDTPANIAANTTSIEWPLATASWGTLGFFELWDAATGGNRLYWGPFSPATPMTVAAGDIVRFSAGNLAVQASSGSGGTTSIGAYLPLAGGSMGGPLLLSHDPTTYLEAATKQYVDAHSGTGGGPGFLPLSGGAMLGTLSLAGNATLPMHAVPLQQVDTLNVVNVLNHAAKGDGTTDDTAAIQAVLDAYAGKATVFIPQTGHYYRTHQLTLPSYTDLLIYGGLQALPGLTGDYIKVGPANYITIRGTGVIDGNKSAQTAAGAGLGLTQVGDARISGITIQNAFYWPINVVQSNNVVVADVTMLGGGAAAEFAAQSDDCWLTNCTIDGTGNGDYGFCFYGGVTNSGAIGNDIQNSGAGTSSPGPGLGVLSDSAQPLACHNIVMDGNILHDNGGPGILVVGQPGAQTNTNIIISNNRSYNNSQIGTGGSGGADIFVDNTTGATIIGNQSSGNGNSGGTVFSGIFLGPQASHVSVIGNHVFNVGKTTTTGVGLWSFNTNYVYVSGNYFYDDQTTPTMQYSLNGNAGTHCAYIGNFCDRPLNLHVQGDTVVANAVTGEYQFGANGDTGDFSVSINGGPNTNRTLQFSTNSVTRWFVGLNGTESGGNSGSDFNIISASDAGALTQTPLSIKRSSGIVTLAGAPIITVLPTNAANDAAAAAAGVQIGQEYRNGSVKMIRVV